MKNILITNFYVGEHYTDGTKRTNFYGAREDWDEANDLERFLITKGYSNVRCYMYRYKDGWERNIVLTKTADLTDEIKHVINVDCIFDNETATFAFYEGFISFKKYNEIVKRIKEAEQ